MDVQDAWRFCTKCYGLFFNGWGDNLAPYGQATGGVCPYAGAHSPLLSDSPSGASDSFFFSVPYANTDPPPASPGGGGSGQPSQDNWRFCTKCYGLFWYGYTTAGVCPYAGAHSPLLSDSPTGKGSSWDYSLPIVDTNPPPSSPGGLGAGSPPASQGNYRFCTKCYGLFWYGYTTAGVCPYGGVHSPLQSDSPSGAPNSINFAVPFTDTSPPDDPPPPDPPGVNFPPSPYPIEPVNSDV